MLEKISETVDNFLYETNYENSKIKHLMNHIDKLVHSSVNRLSKKPSIQRKLSEDFRPKEFSKIKDVINFLANKNPEWSQLRQKLKSPKLLPLPKDPQISLPVSNNEIVIPSVSGHEFSIVPRFEDSPIVYPKSIKSLTPDKKKEIQYRISKTRSNLKKFKVQNTKHYKEIRSQGKYALELMNSINREMLNEKIQEYRKDKLETKFKKLMFRSNKHLYYNIGRSLHRLLVCASVCFNMRFHMSVGKNYIKRINKLKKLWIIFSLVIGKVKLKAIRFRQGKAKLTLQKLFVPILKLRISQIRKKYINSIINVFEAYVSTNYVVSIVYKWRINLRRVKIFTKKIIAIRKARLEALLIIWNYFNEELALDKHEQYRKTLTIPHKVKIFYIRKFICKVLKDYMSEYSKYLQHHHRLKYDWEYRYEFERSLLLGASPQEIKKPSLNLFRRKREIYEYVRKADKNRLNWDRIALGLSPNKLQAPEIELHSEHSHRSFVIEEVPETKQIKKKKKRRTIKRPQRRKTKKANH